MNNTDQPRPNYRIGNVFSLGQLSSFHQYNAPRNYLGIMPKTELVVNWLSWIWVVPLVLLLGFGLLRG